MKQLARSEVISQFLNLNKESSYLEIGVNQGVTFNAIEANRKVAVDPQFMFDTLAYTIPDKVEFFEVCSDEYFALAQAEDVKFDVIYLDGLHTFEQTLRDLLNAFSVIKPHGVVILDDVIPNSFDASLSDVDEAFVIRSLAAQIGAVWHFDGSWMGDVYKVVFFLKSFMQQYSYATVLENHGQTVIWQQTRPAKSVGLQTVQEISFLDYRHTITKRSIFNIMPIESIITNIERDRHKRLEQFASVST
jgi:hypothetical protein